MMRYLQKRFSYSVPLTTAIIFLDVVKFSSCSCQKLFVLKLI